MSNISDFQGSFFSNPCVKEATFYKKLDRKRVECSTCERRCKISKDKLGFCKTRKNVDGKLYTLVYGDISSISANPIEKKPLFHFWPGSFALTVGTYGCNFTCPWCQNWTISKASPDLRQQNYLSMEDFLKIAETYSCQGTSFSFNEPTILIDYALDVMKLTKPTGYYQTYVTNAYMTSEALDALIKAGLDAMAINVKGGAEAVKKYCKSDVEVVWRNAIEAKKRGVHVEIITLVIPTVNDEEDTFRNIAQRIRKELGKDTLWHTTAYHPDYEFRAPRTPVETLEKSRMIGIEEGLDYVYLGNVPLHPGENTYCPSCEKLLIKRSIFSCLENNLGPDNCCPSCGEKISIVGQSSLS